MIGYVNQEPENIDIIANKKSAWLLDAITNHATVYAPELFIYRIINDKYDGSDHRDIGLKAVNWKTDSGKKFLFTISPSSNQANIIDVSLPRISSCDGVSLGDLTPEVFGISLETHSIVIINVADKRMGKVIHKISAPKDVVLVNDELALVCSYDQAKIFSLDMGRKEILGEIPVSPRPVRLILSPQKDLVVSLHQLSPKVDLFRMIPSKGKGQPTMERIKVMDLGEVITDGTFAEDHRCYFVSSGKNCLLGLDLSNEKVFWGMRTGGVRGRADVEKILFIGDE